MVSSLTCLQLETLHSTLNMFPVSFFPVRAQSEFSLLYLRNHYSSSYVFHVFIIHFLFIYYLL